MTPNWNQLLDEASLASVLPSEYSHFARPIRDGLAVFLGGLPDADQAAMLQTQADLAPTATISERLGMLARHCPVLQKLGQVLARDQRLPPELRHYLRQLESLAPTVPLAVVEATLEEELGSLAHRGITLLPPALAEASVAVVIPFRYESSRQNVPHREGVFKVLKPGIEARLDRELELLEQVGEHLDERCEELQIPHLDYQESFQHVRDKLRDEVRLEHEQRHLQLARDFYAGETWVQIPTLLADCTSRVTAMERVTGVKITDHKLVERTDRRELAEKAVRALLARPVFSRARQSMFHGDPHAGNLFFTDDQRLAILDWSLVGTLGDQERIAIVQILLGAATLNVDQVVSVLQSLSCRGAPRLAALTEVVQQSLRRLRQGQLPGLAWLTDMLDGAVQQARLRVSADLMLFRKSLHTLQGVVAAVGPPDQQMDYVMLIEFLSHFAEEWPRRWLAMPQCREFATRLSNLDLARTLCSLPTTLMRFWMGQGSDLLERMGSSADCRA